jgi:hypothetical protein
MSAQKAADSPHHGSDLVDLAHWPDHRFCPAIKRSAAISLNLNSLLVSPTKWATHIRRTRFHPVRRLYHCPTLLNDVRSNESVRRFSRGWALGVPSSNRVIASRHLTQRQRHPTRSSSLSIITTDRHLLFTLSPIIPLHRTLKATKTQHWRALSDNTQVSVSLDSELLRDLIWLGRIPVDLDIRHFTSN